MTAKPSPALRRVARLTGLPAEALVALGISRVARVTTLDRAGVEVAAAIRPGGHVVQVCNGKGASFRDAARGAIAEAAELAAAEQPDPTRLVYGSRLELVRRFGEEAVLEPASLGSAGEAFDPALVAPEVRLSWWPAMRLPDGALRLVPAAALFCPSSDAPLPGVQPFRWSSNGMGAHPSPAAACAHGLLEAIERDELHAALPQGFTRERLSSLGLSPAELARVGGRLAAVVAGVERGGFRVQLCVWRGRIGLPVAAALLADERGGAIPLTAGYAARFSAEEALLAALREAAQSRLTDIHGARDDVEAAVPSEVARLRGWLSDGAREGRAPASVATRRDPVRTLVRLLAAAGHEQLCWAPMSAEGAPLHVGKAIVAGLAISELL